MGAGREGGEMIYQQYRKALKINIDASKRAEAHFLKEGKKEAADKAKFHAKGFQDALDLFDRIAATEVAPPQEA